MKNNGVGDTFGCCIVLIGFITICVLMCMKAVPDSPSLQLLVGGLNGMAAGALYCLTGSSQSSKAKDATIAELASKER
ncbi:hypothetical protein EEDFHM_04588 [Methylorubrum populi]